MSSLLCPGNVITAELLPKAHRCVFLAPGRGEERSPEEDKPQRLQHLLGGVGLLTGGGLPRGDTRKGKATG